jgi:hypothetical protein
MKNTKLSTCEIAKQHYLQSMEKEKTIRPTKAIKYFTKIFPDIQYNKEKDRFILCGYEFEYEIIIDKNQFTNSAFYPYLFAIIRPYYMAEKVYDLKSLGLFLLRQENRQKEEQQNKSVESVINPAKCNKSFWKSFLYFW